MWHLCFLILGVKKMSIYILAASSFLMWSKIGSFFKYIVHQDYIINYKLPSLRSSSLPFLIQQHDSRNLSVEPGTQLYVNPQHEQFRFYVLVMQILISTAISSFGGRKTKLKLFFSKYLSGSCEIWWIFSECILLFHQARLLPYNFS